MHPTRKPHGVIITSPFARAVVGLVAAFALIVTLFHGHCVSASPVTNPLGPTQLSMTASLVDGQSLADHQLPAAGGHCAHCLCNVSSHPVLAFDSTPITFRAAAYPMPRETLARPVAGLPPFKPPRV